MPSYLAQFEQPIGYLNPIGARVRGIFNVEVFQVRNTWKACILSGDVLNPDKPSILRWETGRPMVNTNPDLVRAWVERLFLRRIGDWREIR